MLDDRFVDLERIITRSGPMADENFDPTLSVEYITEAKILVVGAGGLGCEIVKNLAMSGFPHIDIIDMDTIDVSNLNRQFLFRSKDVGRYKAEVAAEFIMTRVPGCIVTPHCCAIQEKDDFFYRQFQVVVTGLDSVEARSWMNEKLVQLCQTDEDGDVDYSTMIPMVDGGTEGCNGHAKVIFPRLNACYNCMMDLYPPQKTYPLCTIRNQPRIPEHCIQYVYMNWDVNNPFNEKFDSDNADHMHWVYEESLARARQFNIDGVTLSKTQGVVKGIIPVIASTNAFTAAVCTNEVVKILTACNPVLKDFCQLLGSESFVGEVHELERKANCPVCGRGSSIPVFTDRSQTLEEMLTMLMSDRRFSTFDGIGNLHSAFVGEKQIYARSGILRDQSQENLISIAIDVVPHGSTLTLLLDDSEAPVDVLIFYR